jgi:hypothetical protein
LSTVEGFALHPSASAVGSDPDNSGAESDQATEEIPAAAIIITALFPILKVRNGQSMEVAIKIMRQEHMNKRA